MAFEPPPKPTATAEWVLVDATTALTWLEGNTENRPVRQTWWEVIGHDVANRAFRGDNGETVKIAADGTLLDGQHRLLGIIAADKRKPGACTWLLVVRGVARETQSTMDIGAVRKLADNLALRHGVKDANHVGACLVRLYIWDQGVRWIGAGGPKVNASKMELEAYFVKHRDEIERAVNQMRRVRVYSRLQGAVLSLAYAVLARIDQERADEFYETWATGEPSWGPRDPVILIRERLLRKRIEGAVPPQDVLALIILAWNRKGAGNRMTKMQLPAQFTPGNFPEPDEPDPHRWPLGGSPVFKNAFTSGTSEMVGDTLFEEDQ